MSQSWRLRLTEFQHQPNQRQQNGRLTTPNQQKDRVPCGGNQDWTGEVIHLAPPFGVFVPAVFAVLARAARRWRTCCRSLSVNAPVSTRCSTSEAAEPQKTW